MGFKRVHKANDILGYIQHLAGYLIRCMPFSAQFISCQRFCVIIIEYFIEWFGLKGTLKII